MLYLIRSFGRCHKLLKIGYTGDLENRMGTYRTNNPFFELLTTREGTLREETLTHLYLGAINLKADILNEWFLDTPQTLTEFHTPYPKMYRTVWKMRYKILTPDDFDNKIKLDIYENLRMIYMRPGMTYKTYEIDQAWKQRINKQYLKNYARKQESESIAYYSSHLG